MIKNIIFDMGNVLIKYDPALFIDRLSLDSEEDQQALLKAVYQSREWLAMDEGLLDEGEAIERMVSVLPDHLHQYVAPLVLEWDRPLIEFEGMTSMIEKLKATGYGLYLLSNASRRQHDYWARVSSSHLFDGTLISADVKQIKPNPEIYQTLFETFDLRPEACFFIDDSKSNIEMSEKLGMAGYVFDGDVNKLRHRLEVVLSIKL